jgi:hypothetical protein
MRYYLTVAKAALVALGLATAPAMAAQTVQSGSGVSTTTALDAFRSDLGGGTVPGANGSFGGVRREINWDGVPAATSAPNSLPANFFNVNSPRGAVFTTPGTGFEVSGAATDSGSGQPAAANFGNIDPSYTTTFAPFSPQRLFTAVGSNIFDVTFFVPGTSTPGLTTGFGAIFSDVDLANTSSIELFGADNSSLGIYYVLTAAVPNGGLSFLGISYGTPMISRVRITAGNAALASGVIDSARFDLVTLDDFIFGEPVAAAVPEPSTWAMMLLGFAGIGWSVRRRKTLLLPKASPAN